MKKTETCPLETRVLAAARSGAWSDALTSHLASCAPCADAALVGAFLGPGAAALERAAPLAGADALLREAARRDRQRALARAQLPLRLARGFAALAGAAAAALAAVRFGPAIASWLAAIAPAALAPPATPAGPALVAGAVLLSALVVGIFTSWQAAE